MTSDGSTLDAATLAELLGSLGLVAEVIADGEVMTSLDGEWRRSLPVRLSVEERHLRLEALLCGAVEQGHAEVYAYLLARNERAGDVRFALDGDGDVLLVGRLGLQGVDADVLSELLGELLATADETFNQVLRLGFASYVERERRWRRATGHAPNPAFPEE